MPAASNAVGWQQVINATAAAVTTAAAAISTAAAGEMHVENLGNGNTERSCLVLAFSISLLSICCNGHAINGAPPP